jgi:hypothetical protein
MEENQSPSHHNITASPHHLITSSPRHHHITSSSPHHHIPKSPHHHITVKLLRQGDAGGDGIARSPVFSHKGCKMLPNDRTMWRTFSVSKLLCVKARCV